MLPFSAFPKYIINLLHNPVGPLNHSGDHGLGHRARLGIEEIVGCLQVTRYDSEALESPGRECIIYPWVKVLREKAEVADWHPAYRAG
jgi:hypothetical protein